MDFTILILVLPLLSFWYSDWPAPNSKQGGRRHRHSVLDITVTSPC